MVMNSAADCAIAIVGIGALMPDAPDAPAFWENIKNKRYSITEVPDERWSAADYYDPDPSTPDKTYSKIGAWVRGFEFDWKKYRIPPKVSSAMDEAQQWAVTIAAEALADYGYPARPLNTERVGVIMGTALGGELHYSTHLRISFPEYAHLLEGVTEFRALPVAVREQVVAGWRAAVANQFPAITEDTMPGELPNIMSGRIANVLNLRGPSFITDAACASSFAAIASAAEMLALQRCDAVIAGGVDRNMGASSFIKFCKIGALSASGTRPFGDGADGFVMGEGSGAFLLKRLIDAERDGDKIYAVIRGVGASSDGKGKGITAPNAQGQVLAIRRAWENAGLDPATATLIEAHGTSTKVGDVVEVESLTSAFGAAAAGSIALGSAKSNVGHLKAGAGAAGLLKTVWAVHDKLLPPTLNAERPNPNIDFSRTPFRLNHELREWGAPNGHPRRAGVSAYGFGGTNFHLVVEEHVPGMLTGNGHRVHAVAAPAPLSSAPAGAKPPLQGILALGAGDVPALKEQVAVALERARQGWAPPVQAPEPAALNQDERLVIDFADHDELVTRLEKSIKALGTDALNAWKSLKSQGIYRGSGAAPGKLAYLFPGQGSQTLNMARKLAEREPEVAAVFAEADRIMTPILGRPLTSYIFTDAADPEATKAAEESLRRTTITQPAMLTVDAALHALLAAYGFKPDYVLGHSLGEYAALVAAGVMPFAHALEAAAARGAEMTRVSMADNGWMAAVIGPYEKVELILRDIEGYVVAANLNSQNQTVIGGASAAVQVAINRFNAMGLKAMRIPVSHAFHTAIVAPASKPLRQLLDRLSVSPPRLPVIANVTGEPYPTDTEAIKDLLERQIASPVQWAKSLETCYSLGVRAFLEVGPKKVLKGFVDNVVGGRPGAVSLFTNHPDFGEIAMFNQALCGLYAAGYRMQGKGQRTDDRPGAIASRATTVARCRACRRACCPPRPSERTRTAANF
jgi:malonyl CoA-acyl carrier protein transacylase